MHQSQHLPWFLFFWEVRKSFWRHGGVQATMQYHSYFEPPSLRFLKETVRFFGWDILLVIELKNVFFCGPRPQIRLFKWLEDR